MPFLLDEGGVPLLAEGGTDELLTEGSTAPSAGDGIAQHEIGRHAIAGDYNPAVVIVAPEPPLFPKLLYTIDLCQGWRRIGEAPAAIFDGVIRDLTMGEWKLTGSVNALAFAAGHDLADVDTIRVVAGSDIVLSGYVAPVATGVGGLELDYGQAGQQFTLTGPDAWSVLASRDCWPTPSTGQPWADSHDLRSGLASTVAAGYILANAGSAALPDRVVPGLNVIDEEVGFDGEWSARLQPLDQQVARVCRDGGITCRLDVDFDGELTATLCNPNDRRNTVVFSDQGDLSHIQIVRTPATSTFVVAGGQGNLTARTFATSGMATGAARREVFSDQSSLATETEVQQAATTALLGAGAMMTVRAEITDAATFGRRYRLDYNIGDTIAIEIGDVRYPAVVESVTVHVSPDRQVIRPVLGAATPNLVTGLLKDVAGLANRLDSQIA